MQGDGRSGDSGVGDDLRRAFDVGVARFALDIAGPAELSDVATTALLLGLDSTNLAALAGSPTLSEVEARDWFSRGLRDANIQPPSKIEAAFFLRGQFALQAVAGKMSPLRAAEEIIRLSELLEIPLKPGQYIGEPFGIAALVGAYYAVDDIDLDDTSTIERAIEYVRDECRLLCP